MIPEHPKVSSRRDVRFASRLHSIPRNSSSRRRSPRSLPQRCYLIAPEARVTLDCFVTREFNPRAVSDGCWSVEQCNDTLLSSTSRFTLAIAGIRRGSHRGAVIVPRGRGRGEKLGAPMYARLRTAIISAGAFAAIASPGEAIKRPELSLSLSLSHLR